MEETLDLERKARDPFCCLVYPPLPHAGEAGPQPVQEWGGGKPVLSLYREKLEGAHVLRREDAAAPALTPKARHYFQPSRFVPCASPGRSPLHHRTWNHLPCQTSWPGKGEGEEKLETTSSHNPPRQRRHSQLLLPFLSLLQELNVSTRNKCARLGEDSLRRQKGVHCPFFLRDGWCLSN